MTSTLLLRLPRTATIQLPTFLIPFLGASTSTATTSFTYTPSATPTPAAASSSWSLAHFALPLPLQLPAAAASIEEALSSLRELLPPWVLAVPKSKTTHSAKSMRSANKGLKEQQNIVACPSCGTPKKAHHLCHECHVEYRREYHQEAKKEAAAGGKDLQV